MDQRLDPMDPTTVSVDFRAVDVDGRLAIDAEGLSTGMLVLASDAAGNRCRAKVARIEAGVAQLELILDSYRAAGE